MPGDIMSDARDLMDVTRFISHVASELKLDPLRIEPGSRLREDIGLDSLGMTVLLVIMREMGARLDEAHVQSLATINDAYELCSSRAFGQVEDHAGTSSGPLLRPSAGTKTPFSSPLVTLRPPRPNLDTEFLFALATGEETGWRWRFRGRTPNRDEYMRVMWQGPQSQFIVIERCQRERIGLLQSIRPSADGYIYITALTAPEYMGSGLMFEALGLFITYLFTNWDYHHVYAEVPEYSYDAFRSGVGELFEVRGHFEDHDFAMGRRWDMFIVGVARDMWMSKVAPRFMAAAGLGSAS
ncbi:MAG: GNAT family N-acetyltransferase [Acidimicrobiales bacterium]